MIEATQKSKSLIHRLDAAPRELPSKAKKGPDFFAVSPLEEAALYRAVSSVHASVASASKGKRKVALKEAHAALKNVSGLAFYILEAGKPKVFYSVGEAHPLPLPGACKGVYIRGNEGFTFDHKLSSATYSKTREPAECDVLRFPIKSRGRNLGALVAQGIPGEHIRLNTERYNCPRPENSVPVLVKYFSELSKLFLIMMDNWFDNTTKLLNRSAFERELYPSMERWLDLGRTFTLLLLDLDRFKAINDTYGHAAGDAVLGMVGEVLERNTKSSRVNSPDYAVRWGGDEFIVLLQGIEIERAVPPAERILKSIGDIKYNRLRLSASIGMLDSKWMSNKKQKSGEIHIMEEIDRTLYASKIKRGGISSISPDGSFVHIR